MGAKKRRVLLGLAIEKLDVIRNVERFLRNILFPGRKKIVPVADARTRTPQRKKESNGDKNISNKGPLM